MKNIKKIDVTRAREEADRWRSVGENAVMMLNAENGSIWTDCFVGENYKVYASETVEKIPEDRIIYEATSDHPLSKEEIDDAIYKYCISRISRVHSTQS